MSSEQDSTTAKPQIGATDRLKRPSAAPQTSSPPPQERAGVTGPGSWEVFLFPDPRAVAEAAARDWLACLQGDPVGEISKPGESTSPGPVAAGRPSAPAAGERAGARGGDSATTPQWSAALSGGRIAREFFAALAQAGREHAALWDAVEFFWADERCVPPDHPESNFALAQALLLGPTAVRPERIHRIRGELDPEEAARLASAELAGCVPARPDGVPVLDWVFLGMGEDGHVASLFPGDPAADSKEFYRAVIAPKPPPRRVTLSYDVLGAAREVWVLVSGPGKEAALRASLSAGGTTPLARVLQRRRHTRIYTDLPVRS